MSENNTQEANNVGGAYDVLKARLLQQGADLKAITTELNSARQGVFGEQSLELIGKANVQTQAKCIPVDMAQVNQQLLFGYQVTVGLKAVPSLSDVFGLYQLHHNDGLFRIEPLPLEDSFLSDEKFNHELKELFTYYNDAKLTQIARQENTLYIAFQIGMRSEDRKVFRFQITADSVTYLDANGHNSLHSAVQNDITWIETTRSDHVLGSCPHVSIQDQIFVECVDGDLTIKVEDNTEEGKGIYSEPVEDLHQSVADAKISYAFMGTLIALKVLPNREKNYRYYLYNPLNQQVNRVDALEVSAKSLPEEHGVLYSHGYVLVNGESKQFDMPWESLSFFQQINSPNGEDILYVFFNAIDGYYVVYTYNLIEKRFAAPLETHGMSLYPNGQMLVFQLEDNATASTIHPLRIWDTPFFTTEYYSQLSGQGDRTDPLFNLGNAELVRALSSVLSICHLAQTDEVTQAAYETLVSQAQSTLDHYHWLSHDYALGVGSAIEALLGTADSIIDEFAKVMQLQQHAKEALDSEVEAVNTLVGKVKLASRQDAKLLLTLLNDLRHQTGRTMVLKQQHYMCVESVDELLSQLDSQRNDLNKNLLTLLQKEQAYEPFKTEISTIETELAATDRTAEIHKLQERVEQLRAEMALVSEEVTSIETQDPTQSTRILDLTTEVTTMLNTVSAKLRLKHDSQQKKEVTSEFSAQFKLLTQSVSSAMEQANTPDECDAQLAKLIGQLEKLESRFADFDDFLAEIYAKREEIQSTLDNHKQQLLANQQRRVQNLYQAATVTLNSVQKRVSRFEDSAELNSYFSTDAMVLKLHQLAEDIRNSGDSVKADSLAARLKALQDESLRALRDNQDIFEQGGKVLRLGKHRFSVNQQPLDLSLVEQQDSLNLHISGTDFYQSIDDPVFLELQESAKLDVASESPDIYRGEYLASLLFDPQNTEDNVTLDTLIQENKDGQLLNRVQQVAGPRFREGYVKGIHDSDAVRILDALLPKYQQAGLLRYNQSARACAMLWLLSLDKASRSEWQGKATNALLLRQHLKSTTAFDNLSESLSETITLLPNTNAAETCDYLIHLLAQADMPLLVSQDGVRTSEDYLQFRRSLGWQPDNTQPLMGIFNDHIQWLEAYTAQNQEGTEFIVEAAAIAVWREHSEQSLSSVDFSLTCTVDGLLGEHSRIVDGELHLVLDDFLSRANHHRTIVQPRFEAYQQTRGTLLDEARNQFRLSEFQARPLTSFVRNKLISESYLPLIGDNFAKQMGAMGDSKRTDLMGMLLLISPPGYGKTTLIEYIARKLGLVFMKINGPSIGHEVTSLDPADAPDQNAAREVEKINLAFEMGNNVLLYLDDIQHTSPEFLQRFISLCDGTRRVEGTWNGKPKTYDMRGKKFAVVMAGNPYTESGEVFRIPDMLANRADIYNLGDMLSDQKQAFELSFIENSLTSNPVLAPLATRDLEDLYRFVSMAQGESIALSEMSHAYSATEANEIVATLQKLMMVQQTVLSVNQQYIASAATADAYRVEPPFKLQGSYRNMNKLSEKISSVMTDSELQQLVKDHYQGEAQTLTAGTEENLLKLAELRGDMSASELERWETIKTGYQRKQVLGDETDRAGQVVQQLVALNQHIASLGQDA
ncbi:DNA repair ATPase [Vibrio sp. WXL210]|uniref:DNA repair ATPase n=1 Tax=Vibrio sp. WXL210 TaxID=3450709 RepID=UPI003EC659C1